MTDKKKCDICGGEFEPKSHNAKYCGEECRKKAAYAAMIKSKANKGTQDPAEGNDPTDDPTDTPEENDPTDDPTDPPEGTQDPPEHQITIVDDKGVKAGGFDGLIDKFATPENIALATGVLGSIAMAVMAKLSPTDSESPANLDAFGAPTTGGL